MLTKTEQLQLIRQAEKCNLNEEDTAKLFKWAGKAILDETLLGMIFKGYVEICKMDESGPSFCPTLIGEQILHEIRNQQDTDAGDDE